MELLCTFYIYIPLHNGWPERVEKQFINIYANQHDLEVVEGVLFYQNRVIVPQSMQNKMLKLLHANHAGVVKMKQLARRVVYWYGINADIERYANLCDACNRMAVIPKQKKSLHLGLPLLSPLVGCTQIYSTLTGKPFF